VPPKSLTFKLPQILQGKEYRGQETVPERNGGLPSLAGTQIYLGYASLILRYQLSTILEKLSNSWRKVITSVADPKCLSRIQIFPSRISEPGSKRFRIPDTDPHQRIEVVFLTQKIGSGST
jgi:hypothetical protein